MEGAEHTNQAGFSRLTAKGSTPFSLTKYKTTKMKQIIVEYGVVRKLCEEFHTSRVTVGAALRLRTNTVLACKIRQRALQLGGVMMEAESIRKEAAVCI